MTKFEHWMQTNGLSESSAKKYRTAISGVMTTWALENDISIVPLMEITSSDEFLRLVDQLKTLPIFQQRDSVGKGMYSSALRKYLQYLDDLFPSPVEQDIDAIIRKPNLKNSDKISLVKTRLGQGSFRNNLISYSLPDT